MNPVKKKKIIIIRKKLKLFNRIFNFMVLSVNGF